MSEMNNAYNSVNKIKCIHCIRTQRNSCIPIVDSVNRDNFISFALSVQRKRNDAVRLHVVARLFT